MSWCHLSSPCYPACPLNAITEDHYMSRSPLERSCWGCPHTYLCGPEDAASSGEHSCFRIYSLDLISAWN